METRKYYCRSKPPCLLADPEKPHKLCRRSDPPLSNCFTCKGQQHLEKKRYYYYCATCDLEFHRGCHYYPPEIRHPYHLIHPLTFTSSKPDLDIATIPEFWYSESSGSECYDSDLPQGSDENYQKCKPCRKNLTGKYPYYHCSTCNFNLDVYCARYPPPLSIENLKSHDHALTLFPRQVPLPCDACGFSLDGTWDEVYSCLLCNYMVHRRCIYLPRVVKITRHQHRLSHTSSLVPSCDEFSCGVCHKPVDISYGNYSCNKGCHYAVHSRCATKDEVWDGMDLEGVLEEEEPVIEPFVWIDKETIQHFTHDHHHLKIQGSGNHENKFCQACILPITVSNRFFSCFQCEFVLHETCASLPRRKHLPIHKHPLTLSHPISSNPHELGTIYRREGFFVCDGCDRACCGFMYKCMENDCEFELDARCASLPDPSVQDCHPHDHPLFFTLNQGECMGCMYRGPRREYIECIKCKSFLCLQCATLPSMAHYKHDKHPLALCCGEEEEEKKADLQYWCEICEGRLDATEWFYTCNACRATLHATCLLGESMYLKPNHIIKIYNKDADVTRNSGNTSPVCDICSRRCENTLVFKWLDTTSCTLGCLWKREDLSSND